ncbi:hypothetical protein V8C43DRAFT_293447 [Trichoderma afarasin]
MPLLFNGRHSMTPCRICRPLIGLAAQLDPPRMPRFSLLEGRQKPSARGLPARFPHPW